MIWKQPIDLEVLNASRKNTLIEHLGIEMCGYGEDYLQAKMPVDHRTVQPFGILHGGASAALAESVGSMASLFTFDDPGKQHAVGIELNASHLRGVSEGYVIATARPYRLGKRIHVWNIEIHDEKERLICVSRLTMAIVAE
ncbi:hotdog fold thioesterase [Haliscomenobacter hydrossis]|uniref:Phenylacetic acid degradation-related protein n=1 Tax=Haliscomenobacter hydrossis (strain ATCC 27775 / DSM 1100 / LMG 10767 / O) TaxID=760192 RepID=F4KY29_HALH1|nr:hotdog fold thioesterase [Haliscomenobacter hydrossis]AEE53654.1 phenylacetic acid degradation-related protein [Haliscomenobacter hydrossis DSM 1100]